MAPRVSVIIPAFNLARYLPAAIDSALVQKPPGGPVEILVIDDGSPTTRLRCWRRTRTGSGSSGSATADSSGRSIAAWPRPQANTSLLLDADDEWPPDRLRRHAEILDAHPSVGLVHGDMEVIDAHGDVIHPSFFSYARIAPSDGRVLGRLLGGNFVSGGACTFRSSLLPAVAPIDADAAYPDWWIAACVAAVAEVVPTM